MIPRRKWQGALGVALAAMLLTAGVVYAGETPSTGIAQVLTEIRELRQSHMETLRTEIEQVIEQAAAAGTITPDEAARLNQRPLGPRWGRHGMGGYHRGPGRMGFRMDGWMWAETPEEVQAFLDEAVQAGRLSQEQADLMLERWNACHGSQVEFES